MLRKGLVIRSFVLTVLTMLAARETGFDFTGIDLFRFCAAFAAIWGMWYGLSWATEKAMI